MGVRNVGIYIYLPVPTCVCFLYLPCHRRCVCPNSQKMVPFSHYPTSREFMGVTQTSFLRYSQVRLFIPTRIPNLLMHCCPDSRNTASKASERISIRTDSDKDRSCTMFMVSIQTSEFVYNNTHTHNTFTDFTHSKIRYQPSLVHIPRHLVQILDYKTSFFLE